MKALLLIVLLILIALAFYYVPGFFKHNPVNCPPGSRYVRGVSGGGFADTDPTDPWGSCASQSVIDKANNP